MENKPQIKYILITGGVISGVGKGIIASSLGRILKSCDIPVTAIKIDPYINIDAGTFSPYEHGEVYVLDDGGEVDLDLGNYERFLDISLHRDNNITTGKIYQQIIEKERRGDYLGKTVQVVPHVTDAIQEWIERVACKSVCVEEESTVTPEVCIVELGGTIGDIEGMPFVEAFRQFQFRVKKENFCTVHVSLVPQPKATGEHKTKPTQSSVRELRGFGLSPDLIICRSEFPINAAVKDKISNFCHVAPEQVLGIHDVSSVYKVPILMTEQNVLPILCEKLHLNFVKPNNYMRTWYDLARKAEILDQQVEIALVGKYTKLEDSYASVSRALQHASLAVGYKLRLTYIEASHLEKTTKENDAALYHETLCKLARCKGVIVPGGFGERGFEGIIKAITWCRKNNVPFLGICLGLQLAVIEFARNVLNRPKAYTQEVANGWSKEGVNIKGLTCDAREQNCELSVSCTTEHKNEDLFIVEMPEHTTGVMGGTMRLGKRTTYFQKAHQKKSVLFQLYGSSEIKERHRHRYEVNPDRVAELESHGLLFVGKDETNRRMEILELDCHPYFVATQFHPEYLSRPHQCSPPFLGLILASVNKLEMFLQRVSLAEDDRDQILNDLGSAEIY